MNFDFSDEQRALAATAREVFERESPPARVRAVLEGADPGDKVTAILEQVGLLDLPSPEDAVLVLEEAGRAALPEPLATSGAGWAAVLNGVSAKLLDMTVEHVTQRHQFGRPVGSFQAVKHKLASVMVAVEQARAASHYAAYAITRDLRDAAIAESAAVVTAYDAHTTANTEALQCHGGIGFTWEHDLHLWLKHGLQVADRLRAAEHRARLADSLGP